MRILSTRLHGMLDYAMGVLLLASPYLFGFATGGAKQWLPMALGAAMIGLALLTDYEFGGGPRDRDAGSPRHRYRQRAPACGLAVAFWLRPGGLLASPDPRPDRGGYRQMISAELPSPR